MKLFCTSFFILVSVLSSSIAHAQETYPIFPGGFDGFKEYLHSEFRYPESARKTKYQGVLGLTLSINTDGTGSLKKLDFSKMKFEGKPKKEDESLMDNVEEDIRGEVERLIVEMSVWEPATHKGKKLRVLINVPMRLVLY